MNILFIGHRSTDVGGAEDDFERLLNHFSRFKDKYNLYGAFPVGSRYNKYSTYLNKTGTFIFGCFPSINEYLIDYFKYLIKFFIQIYQLNKFVNTLPNINIAIVNVSVLLWPIIFLKFKKIKSLVFIRETIKPVFVKKLYYKILNTLTKNFIAVSETQAKDFQNISKASNIQVVYSSNDIVLNDDVIKLKFDVIKNLEIVNIGPISKVKNQILILKALKILKDRNVHCSFIHIGDFDPSSKYGQKFSNFIQSKDLNNHVKMLDRLPNKETIGVLAKCDIAVISSLSEGFPLVISEALSLGVILITTDVGGICDVIKNGYNGFVYTTELELADIIFQIKMDPTLRQTIINNGKITAKKYFNLEYNLEKIEDIIQSLM